MNIRLASLGFGNVGHALATMLAKKAEELEHRYHLTFTYSGALTRTAGGWISHEGITAMELIASGWPTSQAPVETESFTGDSLAFVTTCPADVVLELTTLDPESGQPAIDHIRAALKAGRNVVTANKGPIAYAYYELRALAETHGVSLRFESAVIDGTPIFNMVESSLPVTTISGFRGLLNSTTNYVLGRMAAGETLESAIEVARKMGVAEANPTNDLEGWDAAVKATILANVLMGAKLRPTDVDRAGLGREAMRREHESLLPGQSLRQVVECLHDGSTMKARVRLEALPPSDLLAHLAGTETALQLHTDTMQDLTIIEGEGGPGQTAFGVIADLVTIAEKRGLQR